MNTPNPRNKYEDEGQSNVNIVDASETKDLQREFDKLDFGHRIRIASEVLVEHAMNNKSDYKMKAVTPKGTFIISVVLEEN